MAASSDAEAARAAERAARVSYGRLLAYLARGWRDLTAAEDALGEAFAKALETWPVRGVPANPDAWLLVAARNRLLDMVKARQVRLDAVDTLLAVSSEAVPDAPLVPDKRLELMFVCAHPAIDEAARTPLMLQTVLGLDAARIASNFLVSPAAMGQRLARAKSRIASNRIRFALPDSADLQPRVDAVREAIFAAYGTGWDQLSKADSPRKALSVEAIWLARVLAELTPGDAESGGLLAFMLFCQSRSGARLTAAGRYVPLRSQDPKLWDRGMLEEAETMLLAASRLRRPGRFQIEAAIQSANIHGILTGAPMSKALLSLHESLVSFAPTVGNIIGWAAAKAEVEGPKAGLAVLDGIAEEKARNYQPYWAVRAHLLASAGAPSTAVQAAFEQAIGLCDDAPTRAHLQSLLASAGGN